MYYSLISEKAIMLEKSYYLSIILQAKKIEDSGVTVIKLSSGDPGFNTPKSILMSASLSLDKCINEYTSVRGKTELLNSVQIRLNKALGLYYELDQIISTIGVKGALSLAFDSLINPGDKVLLFAPYWINYITQIKIAGGIPIVVYGDHKNNY